MIKINKHIVIVRTTVPSLSSMGSHSGKMVQAVLERHFENVETVIVNDLHDLAKVVAKQPDLAFLGVKHVPIEAGLENTGATKIWVSAYLETNGINHTGSTGDAIKLDFDKPSAKMAVAAAKLNTAPSFTARAGQHRSAADLPLQFPVFIKPSSAGGGKGIAPDSVVHDFASFEQKVLSISQNFKTVALVEEYLTGREFSVAILRSIDSEELVAMPIELVADKNANGDRLLEQNIKSANAEHVFAVTDKVIRQEVSNLAISAFKSLGARDFGRIDIRYNEQNVPCFLEANFIPSLTSGYGSFPKACVINLGMEYEAMILHITELGLSRNTPLPKSRPGQHRPKPAVGVSAPTLV